MHDCTCQRCGKVFAHARRTALYCSSACKHYAKYLRQRASGVLAAKAARKSARERKTDRVIRYEPGQACAENACERHAVSRLRCKMHYKRWARQQGMERPPSDAWSDQRRSNHHARRARAGGARTADRALLADVIARDGLACAWCHEQVDLAIEWPDRLSKSLDHRVAIANGGEHSLANAQLMHLGCNSSKGTRDHRDAA